MKAAARNGARCLRLESGSWIGCCSTKEAVQEELYGDLSGASREREPERLFDLHEQV